VLYSLLLRGIALRETLRIFAVIALVMSFASPTLAVGAATFSPGSATARTVASSSATPFPQPHTNVTPTLTSPQSTATVLPTNTSTTSPKATNSPATSSKANSNAAPAPKANTQIVVTNTNDGGAGSLLDALTTANQNTSSKTIVFQLPGVGPWTITTSQTLFITNPVIIDGTSQAGYDRGDKRVYIEGARGVSSIFFLTNHGGTYIQGLGIYNYDANGVTIWKDASWNFVDDDYIGFKRDAANGTILHNSSRAQYSAGIGIQGSYNKVRRSTISGVYNGINVGESIEQPTTGLITHDNLFEYNKIGTDPTGQTTVGYGNTSTGIFCGAGVQDSWIGGYNVIAGHGGSAVEILHPTDKGNRVYYNYLGVNDGGTAVIQGPTNNQGIMFGNDSKSNGAWGNVIAGNRLSGVLLSSADGNFVLNNTIGLNQAQTQALPGQNSGIVLNIDGLRTPGVSSVRNSIQGNMICGEQIHGIEMYSAVGNGVYNNWIGQNSQGVQLANRYFGVYLQDSSYNQGGGNAWGSNGSGRIGEVRSTGNTIS